MERDMEVGDICIITHAQLAETFFLMAGVKKCFVATQEHVGKCGRITSRAGNRPGIFNMEVLMPNRNDRLQLVVSEIQLRKV